MNRQPSLEHALKRLNINWPSYYLDYAFGPALYGLQLQLNILTFYERPASMHEDVITSLRTVMTAIAQHSKGYLTSEMYTLSKLKMITYTLPHMTQ